MSAQYANDDLGNTLWDDVLDYIRGDETIDGDLSRRLLEICMNSAVSQPDYGFDSWLPDITYSTVREDADEWDFIDPVMFSKGRMREPVAVMHSGISQADIVNQLIRECQDEPELAERLRQYLEKYL